jgi:hypothetical protein
MIFRMTILSFLDHLGTPTPAGAAPRRSLLRQLGQTGLQLAAASLPVALGALPAQAHTQETELDTILLLLKLEEVQLAFYTQAVGAAALADFRPDLVLLQTHQQGHVTFLRQTLTSAGVTSPASPSFDFSGQLGNPANPVLFPDVFTNVTNFLQLAQQLEDAGTSIYLSQISFITSRLLRTALLRMQSVEARHAAHIRTLRRGRLSSGRVKSWPSRADTMPSALLQVPTVVATSPATTTSIYTFENNETQLAALVSTSIPPVSIVPFATLLTDTKLVQANSLAEAFDEPLPTSQATALLALFG